MAIPPSQADEIAAGLETNNECTAGAVSRFRLAPLTTQTESLTTINNIIVSALFTRGTAGVNQQYLKMARGNPKGTFNIKKANQLNVVVNE